MAVVFRASLFILVAAVTVYTAAATKPLDLPSEQKEYMTSLYEIYSGKLTDAYPLRTGGRFAVLTLDNAGANSELDPCPGPVTMTGFEEVSPKNVIARSWERMPDGLIYHAEMVIVENYLWGMLYDHESVHGTFPSSVSLFVNIFNCKEQCASILVDFANEFSTVTFYIGYKHMHARNVESIQEVLDGASNIYFGDVSSTAVYVTSDTIENVCTFVSISAPGVLYGARDDFKAGSPPEYEHDNWDARATLIGRDGWSYARFLFFSPNGELYAVFHDRLNKDVPPTDDDHPWLTHSTHVGSNSWNPYSFLFFDNFGYLYAASSSGLYKGLPPQNPDEDWSSVARVIGTFGWDDFQFLFMHPSDSMMYAVKNGAFYRGTPPSESISAETWLSESIQIGTNGWDEFKFLFFHPCGLLYAAGYDGTLRVGSPPQFGSDDFYSRSEVIGSYGWNDYNFLFFHPAHSNN